MYSEVTISGRFFEDSIHRAFNGQFIIDDSTGQLVGNMQDVYGFADYVGQRLGDSMCWTKIYRGRKPHGDPITYDFRRADRWEGMYRYGPQELFTGGATCVLGIPLPSAISPEEFAQKCSTISAEIGIRRAAIAERFQRLNE